MAGKKTPDMFALENCFKELKTKTDVEHNLSQIQRILKRSFDINFRVSIVENKTNKFFGMSIYPQEDYLHKIVMSVLSGKSRLNQVVEMWQENKEWILEIDSILLYDTDLNSNPAEIVAVLMHEVGHVVYSNTVPQRMFKVVRYELMKASIAIKKLVQWPRVQKLFDLALIEACSAKNYRYINLEAERAADSFVVKIGYGENLDNFIGKLLVAQGNSLINRTDDELDRDVKSVVTWTITNISELEFRKSKLRETLQTEVLKNPSHYVRGIVLGIRKAFFGSSDETYKSLVTEQFLVKEAQRVVTEGFMDLFDKFGKVKKITQSDIDVLSVELNRIDNDDDKIYVLDLIYDKLDVINAALQLISENKKDKVPVPKETLNSFKTQLEKMRKDVLDLQIKPKTYGVFIKYPKGYEG